MVLYDASIRHWLSEEDVGLAIDITDLLVLDLQIGELLVVVGGGLAGLPALLARRASGCLLRDTALGGLGGLDFGAAGGLLGGCGDGGRVGCFGLELALDLAEGDVGGARGVLSDVSGAGYDTVIRVELGFTPVSRASLAKSICVAMSVCVSV